MPAHPPKSYDEIIRRTVPDPEGSWRPNDEQVRVGYRALDDAEQELHDRVRDALITMDADTTRIAIEVERDRVTLRGTLPHDHDLHRIESVITRVEGVGELVDWLVIES
jgi:osmotically-inducible protein OsmY